MYSEYELKARSSNPRQGGDHLVTGNVARHATLEGQGEVASLHLVRAEIQEAMSEPFCIHAECVQLKADLNPDDLLGLEAVIRVVKPERNGSGRQPAYRWYHGHIAEVFIEHARPEEARCGITIRPRLWFLDHTQDCRIFQDMSSSDIVNQLCREHGVKVDASRLVEPPKARDYCVQYNETTLAFLQRILGEDGIGYFFDHTHDAHTLVLADWLSCHRVSEGYESVAFDPSMGTGELNECAWGLQERCRVRPQEFTTTDYDFVLPRNDLNVVRREVARGVVHAAIFDYPGEYVRYDAGDHRARVRLEQLRLDARSTTFETNARGVAVGGLVELQPVVPGLPVRRLLIVRATTLVVSDPATSEARVPAMVSVQGKTSHAAFHASMQAIDQSQQYRPAWPRRAVLVDGPQTATVVGPEGEEIYTDEHGRVKLQFHWDRYGRGDERSSCWVRVSEPWAGKGWGGLQIPRIGQEVIVDFLDGDPDRPIITGRLYNGLNKPPQDLPSGKMISGMRSKTYKGGGNNEITFDDTDGSQKMFIQAQYDQVIKVNNNRSDWVGLDEQREVVHDRTRKVGNNEDVRVDVNQTLSVGGDRSVSVTGNENYSVSMNRTKQVLVAENNLTGVIKSEQTGVAHIEMIGLAHAAVVGLADVTVAGLTSLNVTGLSRNDMVGQTLSVYSGADTSMKADANYLIEAAAEAGIKAGSQVVIDCPDITLKAGGNFIRIDASGVTISGAKVKINSGGDAGSLGGGAAAGAGGAGAPGAANGGSTGSAPSLGTSGSAGSGLVPTGGDTIGGMLGDVLGKIPGLDPQLGSLLSGLADGHLDFNTLLNAVKPFLSESAQETISSIQQGINEVNSISQEAGGGDVLNFGSNLLEDREGDVQSGGLDVDDVHSGGVEAGDIESGGIDTRGDGQGTRDVASGGVDPRDVHSGGVNSGDVHSGGLQSGDVASGGLDRGDRGRGGANNETGRGRR